MQTATLCEDCLWLVRGTNDIHNHAACIFPRSIYNGPLNT